MGEPEPQEPTPEPEPTPDEGEGEEDGAEAPVAVAVEPKLSLEDFCLTQTLRPMHRKALERWVTQHRTPAHADLKTWRGYLQEMLAHTPSV